MSFVFCFFWIASEFMLVVFNRVWQRVGFSGYGLFVMEVECEKEGSGGGYLLV